MADSIKFTIGGQLGPSYRGALSQAVAESRVATQQINSEARKAAAIASGAAVDMSRLGQFKVWKAEYLAARAEEARLEQALANGGTRRAGSTDPAADEALLKQQGLIRVRVAELAAQRAAAAENDIEARASLERLAIRKAEWKQKELYNSIALAQISKDEAQATEATLLNVARGHGAAASGAGGGHGGGGMAGSIRESLVILREASRGNWTRMAGSVTLLSQYLGLLGKVVKSTAAETVIASAAESKLAQSMATAALAARGKAGYSALASAAMAQEAKAAKAAEEAEIALAAAKVSVNPLGWVLIAGAAIGAVLFGWIHHLRTLAAEAKNLHDLLDPLRKKFTEQADAVREAASEHQKYLDYLKKIGEETESLPDKIAEVIKKLREESQAQIELARARGANKEAIEAMEEAQLKEELEAVNIGKFQAQLQYDQAQNDLAAKEAKYNADVGDAATLHGAQNAAKNAGDILDAVLDKLRETPFQSKPTAVGALQGALPFAEHVKVPTSEDTEFSVKAGDGTVTTSVTKAKEAFNSLSAAAKKLADDQQAVSDAYSDAKSTLKERNDAVRKLSKDEQDYQAQLGIKEKYGRQIAAAGGGSNGRGGVSLTDWERAGASFGGHAVSALDLGKQQLDVQKRIEKNTARKGSNLDSRRFKSDVDFGDGPGNI